MIYMVSAVHVVEELGASANVVVAGMSERAGRKISFVSFMAYGIPVTLISLAVAAPYVLLRYYL